MSIEDRVAGRFLNTAEPIAPGVKFPWPIQHSAGKLVSWARTLERVLEGELDLHGVKGAGLKDALDKVKWTGAVLETIRRDLSQLAKEHSVEPIRGGGV